MSAIVVRELCPDELAWANQRYDEVGFQPSSAVDRVVVAEIAGSHCGLGRLVPIGPGEVELGGIWTASESRGQGIARAVVVALFERAGAAGVWCIPFVPLSDFYRQFGLLAWPRPWPQHVEDKVRACIDGGLPPVTVLRRAG